MEHSGIYPTIDFPLIISTWLRTSRSFDHIYPLLIEIFITCVLKKVQLVMTSLSCIKRHIPYYTEPQTKKEYCEQILARVQEITRQHIAIKVFKRAYQASQANPYNVSVGTAITFPNFSDWIASSANSFVAGRTTPAPFLKLPSQPFELGATFAQTPAKLR